MIENYSQLLHQYAHLTIQFAVNLQPGQRLLIRAPIQAYQLVEELTAAAYQAGASLVIPYYNHEQLTRLRFELAPSDSFDQYPTWLADGMAQHLADGGALLSISGDDPDLLLGHNQELIARSQRAFSTAMRHFYELVSGSATNWNIIAYPNPAWARKIFPELSKEQAVDRLWQLIFTICRIDQPDPLAAWQAHMAQLNTRAHILTEKQYTSLHYRAPGTDFRVGMPAGHIWGSAGNRSQGGVDFISNVPTEEIYTLADRARAEGVLSASMPLSYNGSLIEGLRLRFAGGRVVEVHAERGESVVARLVETDEGAARLGELALVPHSSPIRQSGVLFFNTLFDENAANHVALGRAYRSSLQGGLEMSHAAFIAAGGNSSLIHVDFMIGSAEMDIDGITSDGQAEAIMRQGEFVF
jgi:aminopeptidase